MKEIRIHGRGGQGVVTAAELIAIASFKSGKEAQAFPSFGVERTGAPIESYARIDSKFIRTRQHIYTPDFLIVQDASLLNSIDISSGCHNKTIVIINTQKDKKEFNIKNINPKNVYTINATLMALDILGKNISNTVLLGYFAKVSGLINLKGLEQAIKEKFIEKGKDIIKRIF